MTPDYALLDRMGLGSVMFYPRPDPSPAPPGALDLPIEVEPGVAVGARWYQFDRAMPTVLYFHGNGEVAGDHDEVAPLYRQAGANLFVVDYRGYGKSGGQPSFAAIVADTGPVVARFHELLDEGRWSGTRFVMGRSLGAHPALEIAANRAARFRGLIIESGAGNMRRLAARIGGEATAEVSALMDAHEAKIRSIRLPVLIIHGERDELIPLESAVGLYDMLEGTDREMLVIPSAGHNDILWVGYREYFAAVGAFIAANSGADAP